jgi:DNA adenine methylase
MSLYSPLRYPGGKASLAPTVSSIISYNGFSNLYYAEPFAGGAGVALDLLFSGKVSKIFLNDLDYHIYAFWRSILDYTDLFCNRIKTIPLTVAQWKKQKIIFDNYNDYSLFDVGFATFYLNRTNRSGILNAKPIGGYNQEGHWKIDARFYRKELVDRILKISCFKQRIFLSNMEAIHFIKKLNNKTKRFFVYLDPPYYKPGPKLYLNFLKPTDHKLLSQYIQNIFCQAWIITYDVCKEISEFYKSQKSLPLNFFYRANLHKKGREILYLCPQLNYRRQA